ncbi:MULTISPECIES: hypothetical protein [unclassified Avibacterium]|uniref:hypothetical protein n=1 Tax=unclassified Avibacterium TaxID=2685287 RepID=UPI002025F39F|nr:MULTISPECIES: hypothetical protein [unclassified Avibacterium]MCW9716857.1 hypothetical protein [Avibacterium sp. 21-599]MCW9734200.1 hypothetical protein [Avibacterium sp. 20-15]URL03623.1 hypothetical protein L4F93_08620 [Avibacterium sp. 20-132]URL03835.1 hypothetical protein L4F93_09775 [Avibacterium sp. 20-132]URL05911.1 hypothetical protein L4F92_07470 [Avibacterium sp. 21-595]
MNNEKEYLPNLLIGLFFISAVILLSLIVMLIYENVTGEAIFSRSPIQEICIDDVTYLRIKNEVLTVKVDTEGNPVLCK